MGFSSNNAPSSGAASSYTPTVCYGMAGGALNLNSVAATIEGAWADLQNGQAVLVQGHNTPANDGVYVYNGGVLTRHSDWNVNDEIIPGKLIYMYTGHSTAPSLWACNPGSALATGVFFTNAGQGPQA